MSTISRTQPTNPLSSSSLSTTTLTNHIYNNITIPSSVITKCSCCLNQKTQTHLQQQLGSAYYIMPERYVDVYVCGFCKKLDQQKCQYCWQIKPCCRYRQKILYKEYFNMLKKELLNATNTLLKTVRKYDNNHVKSSQLSLLTPTTKTQTQTQTKKQTQNTIPSITLASSSLVFNQLITTLNKIQQQLKQQISQNISINNKTLNQTYTIFQQQLLVKIKSFINNKQQQKRDKQQISNSSNKSIKCGGLQQIDGLIKQVQTFTNLFQQQAYELGEKYLQRVNCQYGGMLFSRIKQQFGRILTPNTSYKSSLSQTNNQGEINNSSKISSAPTIAIHKNNQSLQERIKELQSELLQKNKIIQKQLLLIQENACLRQQDRKLIGGGNMINGDVLQKDKVVINNGNNDTSQNSNNIRSRKHSESTKKIQIQQHQQQKQKQKQRQKSNKMDSSSNSSWLQDVVNEIGE